VTLFSDRFFKHNMQKPFESAATWAHVARVTPGLVEALRGPGFGKPPGPPRPDGAARPLIRRGQERRTEGSERRTARGGRGRRGWAFGGAVGPLEARLGCSGPDPFLPYSFTLSLPTQACRLLVSPRDPPLGYKIPVQNPCKNHWPGQGMIPWPGAGRESLRRGPTDGVRTGTLLRVSSGVLRIYIVSS
jgi:hypothetical protein